MYLIALNFKYEQRDNHVVQGGNYSTYRWVIVRGDILYGTLYFAKVTRRKALGFAE